MCYFSWSSFLSQLPGTYLSLGWVHRAAVCSHQSWGTAQLQGTSFMKTKMPKGSLGAGQQVRWAQAPELKPASHAGSRVWQHELVSGGPSCSRTVSFLSQSSHPAQGLCCTRRSESETPFSDGHQSHGLLLDSGPSPLSLYHHSWLQPSQVLPGISPYGGAALSSDQIPYNYPSTFPSSIKNFTLLS